MVLLHRPLNEVSHVLPYSMKFSKTKSPPPLNPKMPILGAFTELQKLQIMFLKLLWMKYRSLDFHQTPDGCYSLRQGGLFNTIILTLDNTYSSGSQSMFFFWK